MNRRDVIKQLSIAFPVVSMAPSILQAREEQPFTKLSERVAFFKKLMKEMPDVQLKCHDGGEWRVFPLNLHYKRDYVWLERYGDDDIIPCTPSQILESIQ